MPTQTETLKKLLLHLEEKIKALQDKSITEEGLKKEDSDIRAATERRLQVAIECCIDIARHIIAGENLGVVEHNKDAVLLLGKKEIIPKKLALLIAEATDMRNVLVHGYQKITYQEISSALKENLQDLKEFAKHIDLFINKKKAY